MKLYLGMRFSGRLKPRMHGWAARTLATCRKRVITSSSGSRLASKQVGKKRRGRACIHRFMNNGWVVGGPMGRREGQGWRVGRMRTSAFVRLSEMVSHEMVGRIFSSNDDMTTCGCAASIDASLVGGTPIWAERRTRRGVDGSSNERIINWRPGSRLGGWVGGWLKEVQWHKDLTRQTC